MNLLITDDWLSRPWRRMNVLRISKELGERLRERLAQIGWQLEGDKLIPTEGVVQELFFPKGSQHDAYVEIRGLLKAATQAILVIDPYIDGSIFELLASVDERPLEIRILTSKVPNDFRLEAQKFVAQHDSFRIEIRLSAEFHDRFVVVDGTTCYHIGASIKDAGGKAFMLSRLEDVRNRDALLQQQRESWAAGKPLEIR